MKESNNYKAIVIGTSAGGFHALRIVLEHLPRDFPIPILVVRHQLATVDDYLIKALNKACHLHVCYAEENLKPVPGNVYIAPPDTHLLVNKQGLSHLSSEEPVNFSRPSIDVLFKSAAEYYQSQLIAVVLTGANADGTEGAKVIKSYGGIIIVQDPESAEAKTMPESVISELMSETNKTENRTENRTENIVWLDQIGPKLWDIFRKASG